MECLLDVEAEAEYPDIYLAEKMVIFLKSSLNQLSEEFLDYLTQKHRLISM